MFHEKVFPFASHSSLPYTDLIPLPNIPSISSVFLDHTSSITADSILQIHHDLDLDDQAFPDAIDHVVSDAFDHGVSPDPAMLPNVPRRSTRISNPSSYLKAYHCNQVSLASISNQSQPGTFHHFSSFLSYANLSPAYKSYCCSISITIEPTCFS